jgi:hypothetical protein
VGCGARARLVVHLREPVLVVQHVLDGGLRRHAASDVSGRRSEAARRAYKTRPPASSGDRAPRSAARSGSPPRPNRWRSASRPP